MDISCICITFNNMAQGNLKLQKKKPARVTKRQKNPKAAAPKIFKSKNVSAREKEVLRLAKGHQGNLFNKTEQLISGRVGHLELLSGDRRSLEKIAKEKAAKQKK